MIDLHYWTTPNGHKITIFLEETGLPYQIIPVPIGRGAQFEPDFLAISPNNRIPAIVDHSPADGNAPLALFESGAILLYLAEKTGCLLPADSRGRYDTIQWLMWQMGGFGPMLGQNHHFRAYAPEPLPYAIERYTNEAKRLYAVLNKRLAAHEFMCGEYSIADIATYPWSVSHERQGIDLRDYPHVNRWFTAVAGRAAVQRAYAQGDAINTAATVDDERAKDILFGQTDSALPAK